MKPRSTDDRHPRDVVIDSMARTLLVLAYTNWCDAWDEARGKGGRRPPTAVSARGGQDWFDVCPADPASFRVACRTEAAILYGRIWQAWGAEPWLVLHWNDHTTREPREKWGHYAVMSAVGHGVAWEDSEDPLQKGVPDEHVYTMLGQRGMKINIETPTWPGRWPVSE